MFDRIKAGVKKLAENYKQQAEKNAALEKVQQEFNDAYNAYSQYFSLMDDREMLYRGTKDVDANVNSKTSPKDGRKKANNVRNICREFVETLVDSNIPAPLIKAKRKESEPLAQVLEESLKSDLLEVNAERLNDYDERTTHIQGKGLFEVYWDKTKNTHSTIGDIGIRRVHPKQFIPYPNVWQIQEMPYLFTMSSVTKAYIKKRYGVDVENEEEQYPDANSLNKGTYSSPTSSNVTECVKWYKDDDGEVGRYAWVNDTVLEDIPKFFHRKIDGKDVDTFTLAQDYTDTNGNVIIPAMTQNADEARNITMVPTELPYFVPDRYPFVLRENTPLDFQFGGESDIDVIRDQQDAIKKVGSNIEEKIMSVGSVVTIPSSQKGKFKLTNEPVQVAYVQPNEISQFNAFSMKPDLTKDIEFFNQQYDAAQATLGITDALQGKPDASARSGTAKQLQIAQSTGRMKSVQANKIQAYKELYEIMFQFKLAYMDEPRPYVTKGDDGSPIYAEFNRLDYLKQDITGTWYYDTDFIIQADANGGLPSDRTWLLSQAVQLLQYQAFGPVQDPNARLLFWQMLRETGFPNAAQIYAELEKTIAQQQQAQQMAQFTSQQPTTGNQGVNPQIIQEMMQTRQNGAQQTMGGMQ